MYNGYPITFKKEGKTTYSESKLHEIMAFWEDRPSTKEFVKLCWNSEKIQENMYGHESDSDKGGTFKDLFKPCENLDEYKKHEEKLKDTNIWSRLEYIFRKQNVRKRVRSAYDGDFDYDKRWELEPFSRREKRPGLNRIVKIEAELCFSGSVSPETIDKYGALICALVNLLEDNGFLAEVWVTSSGDDHWGEDTKARDSILVKSSDQYMPLQSLLRVFSAVFFRRLSFAHIILHADYVNKDVSYGLGHPHRFNKIWEVQDRTLRIYSVPDFKQQHDIVQKLISELTKGEE